jgi:hypothetical protein
MCSGYFGWLSFEAKNSGGEQFQGPAAAPSQPASSSSAAEYTPLKVGCQYVVVIFFFNAL